jgi:hypothetical protein
VHLLLETVSDKTSLPFLAQQERRFALVDASAWFPPFPLRPTPLLFVTGSLSFLKPRHPLLAALSLQAFSSILFLLPFALPLPALSALFPLFPLLPLFPLFALSLLEGRAFLPLESEYFLIAEYIFLEIFVLTVVVVTVKCRVLPEYELHLFADVLQIDVCDFAGVVVVEVGECGGAVGVCRFLGGAGRTWKESSCSRLDRSLDCDFRSCSLCFLSITGSFR